MLHGAGGEAGHSIEMVRAHADRLGAVLLAPTSRGASWDIIAERGFGTDVQAIDNALKRIFAAFPVDPRRVAVSGFSDGASYALSVGLTNGDLFSHVLAFAPGFMVPTRHAGTPSIFISHGVDDRVLPIDRCSRRIVPQLRRAGHEVEYREFAGGHTVPPGIAADAFAMLGPESG
jgi:phospholipase/carboxylesterase